MKTPDLAAAEAAIGYTFSDKALLARCFCHSSAANLGGGESNERLEFLGDAVVQLYVTDLLYRTDGGREGALTAKRQSYVSRGALEAACEALGLVDYLRYTGDVLVHGKTAANLYEAVVGGIYLDGGYAAAGAFLARTLLPQEAGNFRALLQEFVQARSKALPVYSSQETEGGVVCTVSALGESAEACAPTKKLAERAAARCLFGKLSEQ